MFATALTLAQLLASCAPSIGSRTMGAIVRVESDGNPLVIHDNTLSRSFFPKDTRQAVAWAHQLLGLRHSIDLGLSQINSANLQPLGLSVNEAFNPCTNLAAGSTILASDYRAATSEFGPGQYALRRAIGAYNSGSLYAGYGYIHEILVAAGVDAPADIVVPDLQRVAFPAPDQRTSLARRTRRSSGVVASRVQGNPLNSPILVSFPPAGPASSAVTAPGPQPVRVRMRGANPQSSSILLSAPAPTAVPAKTASPAVGPSVTVLKLTPPSPVVAPVVAPLASPAPAPRAS